MIVLRSVDDLKELVDGDVVVDGGGVVSQCSVSVEDGVDTHIFEAVGGASYEADEVILPAFNVYPLEPSADELRRASKVNRSKIVSGDGVPLLSALNELFAL